jgi:flavodoxin
MKSKTFLLAIMAILFTGNMETKAQSSSNEKKILVVYYSWSSSGNTRNMAEKIKAETSADIFEIVPVRAYPRDYQACVDQAKDEINRKFKPEIKGEVANFDSYDIVFIGSPNWWSTVAPPVATFLTSYNFEGKTIVPFMTHEGTRMGHSEDDIKELCPNATVLKGLPIRGGSVNNSLSDIQKWLKDLGIVK